MKMALRRLAVLLLAAPLVAAVAPAQDGGSEGSREQATLIDEQERLERKLTRLKEQMLALADRFEGEGRVHAAKLLRSGIEELDLRDESSESKTLSEVMEASREDIKTGRSVTAINRQEAVIARLERLLGILLDRQAIEDLEKSLQELAALKEALGALADREHGLQEQTAALRETSANEAQRQLEQSIAQLREEQRRLLEQNEEAGRESGVLELEALQAELARLIEHQRQDASVLESWKPEERDSLEALREALESARESAAREDRYQEAAQHLREAAAGMRAAQTPEEREAVAAELARAAEREERHARASDDPAAAESARALSESARETGAAQDAAAGEQAAKAADERAAALESAAQKAGAEAGAARESASERAGELASEPSAAGMVAEDVAKVLESASLEEALGALERGREALDQMGEGLALSQDQSSREASTLAEQVEAAAATRGKDGESAREELESAAETMQKAADSAQARAAEEGARQARAALEALERAAQALARSKEQASSSSAASSAQQAAQESSQQSAQSAKAGELAQQSESASLSPQSKQEVQQALERAKEAMQRAAGSLQSGQRSQAASEQREAMDELATAQQAAERGVQPSDPQSKARAEELAKEQEKIREELLALARRLKERQSAVPPPDLSQAEQQTKQAEESLSEGELDQAEQQEEQAEREMRKAVEELEEEEKSYQELRQEELLFKITEEVTAMLDAHRKQMEATVEIETARMATDSARASRADRLRLRNVAREEEAIAERAATVVKAILEEGAHVFAEVLDGAQSDLREIARRMSETGGFRSDEGVQALQAQAESSLAWLLEALKNELSRRQNEQQQQQQGQQNQQNQKPPLVPDVAELKLLRRIEVDVLERIDQLLLLNPELGEGQIDPLVLEDLSRLAYRHQRLTELFQDFRRRIGIADPAAEDDASDEHP